MGNLGKLTKLGVVIGIIAILRSIGKQYGWDKEEAIIFFKDLSNELGFWAIPLYVLTHTITLALCLPYAVFFEAGASLLFGFFPAVLCVFCAKVLGASLSFWIGRFRVRLTISWVLVIGFAIVVLLPALLGEMPRCKHS
ncbi:uncharacterized protein LOC113271468 isoform X2 [Papaver somniferum]|uniref:uncharacterized protein LOC113271468 isoform X2 n=1 Tax=Papaver somniferum TaxID=3469 RepID=UPI000E70428C|nr:uncharacterized protein LOC113271468 isoform X2 [Papaver somniferum]